MKIIKLPRYFTIIYEHTEGLSSKLYKKKNLFIVKVQIYYTYRNILGTIMNSKIPSYFPTLNNDCVLLITKKHFYYANWHQKTINYRKIFHRYNIT